MSAPATTAPLATPARPGRNALGSLIIVAITGVLILGAVWLSDRPAAATGGDFTPVTVDGVAGGTAPIVGQPAPEFAALMTDGTQLRLSDFRGKPVWLTFGASWCQPCRAENPDIEAAFRAQAGAVTVIQVYMAEDAASVLDYTQRVGISYVTVPDPSQRLAAQYRILGIPSHFFIDAQGVLRQIKVGSLDPPSMQAALAGLSE